VRDSHGRRKNSRRGDSSWGDAGVFWLPWNCGNYVIADTFYENLFKNGSTMPADSRPDTTQAARALCLAVAKLCSENVSFLRWVPFIHLGRWLSNSLRWSQSIRKCSSCYQCTRTWLARQRLVLNLYSVHKCDQRVLCLIITRMLRIVRRHLFLLHHLVLCIHLVGCHVTRFFL